MIWKRPFSVQEINEMCKNTIHDSLGIQITQIGDDFIAGEMIADKRTHQPAGLVHGGANVVLAESLGSIASLMMVDLETQSIVGLEVNANHIRPVESGKVFGKATPINLGRKIHIWEIKLTNSEGKLTCVSRLTVTVIKKHA